MICRQISYPDALLRGKGRNCCKRTFSLLSNRVVPRHANSSNIKEASSEGRERMERSKEGGLNSGRVGGRFYVLIWRFGGVVRGAVMKHLTKIYQQPKFSRRTPLFPILRI